MADPKFKKRIRKLQGVKIQEIIDGCNECQELGIACSEHYDLIASIIVSPKRHIAEMVDASVPVKPERNPS